MPIDINPETLAAFQSNGWIPGANPPPAAPPPAALPPPVPPPPSPGTYVGIGQQPAAFPKGGYGPGNVSQAQADAAFQASLTNGGPVAGAGASAGGPALLPPAQTGPGTPAGMRPSTASTEIKSGIPETPGMQSAEQNLRTASAGVDRAQEDLSAVQPLEAKARAQEEFIYGQHLQSLEAKRQADFATELSNEKWKRDKAQAAYDLATSKGVDPSRYYSKKGLPGTFATALSVMAGGFLAGFKGGSNQAMEMVDKGIDREVHAQEENIANKKNAADEADNHLSLFMKEGMDRNQAAAAAQVMMRQDFAKALDAKYSATSDAMGKLTLQQAKLANAQKMADAEQNYAKLTGAQVTQKLDEKYQAATGGGVGPTRKQVEDLAEKLVLGGKYSNPDEAIRAAGHMLGYDPKGAGPVANAQAKPGSDKVSPRLGVRLAAVDDAGNALDDIEKMEGGSWRPGPEGQAAGAGAVTRGRAALLQAGVPPEEVDRVLPKDYNPASAHMTGGPKERLNQARLLLDQQKRTIRSAVDMSKGAGASETSDEGGS